MADLLASGLAAQRKLRQLCRTDLFKLCHVLGFKDVTGPVHGPIIDILQKFEGGEDNEDCSVYKPFIPLPHLVGKRKRLILDPRGHLKTTVITISHTIQAIINYPNIRCLISTATGDQVDNIMNGILAQFRYNEDFRTLFPEYCPASARVSDFGSREKFTVPCRTDFTLKEPTVWSCTVGKVIAGGRADMVKHSDLVDKENVKTPGGINEVINHFKHLIPLLERYNAKDGHEASRGWLDVEGTRYDFGDLYGFILKNMDDTWATSIRSAEDGDMGNILWPQRFSEKELKETRKDMGDWEYSAQYLNKCVPQGDGLCDPKDVAFLPPEVIGNLLPTLRLHCTIDLAGMEQARSGDYTVLTVGGFDRDGRLYIVDIRCGHYSPEEVIEHVFAIHRMYPNLIDFKIEKEAHARVLLPFLQREMSKRQRYPVLWPIKRDTHTSKQHRIRGLRPWFKTGNIRFSNGLSLATKSELLEEISQFPSQSSGVHDDILDTLADLMQNRDGGVTEDVIADSPSEEKFRQFGAPPPKNRFMGFDDQGTAQWLFGNAEPNAKSPTGFLN